MILLHADVYHQDGTESQSESGMYPSGTVYDLIDGKLWVFPANEPIDVPDDIGKLVMQHQHHHGFVEVPQVRTKSGITFDVDGAIRTATGLLEKKEIEQVNEYVRTQMEDRVRSNFPALPPQGTVLRIIERRNIDLAKHYNLRPLGWKGTTAEEATGGIRAPLGLAETDRVQLAEVKEDNRQLRAKLDELIGMLGGNPPDTATDINKEPTPISGMISGAGGAGGAKVETEASAMANEPVLDEVRGHGKPITGKLKKRA